MNTFDKINPPNNFKAFKTQVLNSVEEIELSEREEHTLGLFLVSRDGYGDLIYGNQIFKRQDDEDLSEDDMMFEAIPNEITSFNSKFVALVLPAEIPDDEEEEEFIDVVYVLISEMNKFLAFMSYVEYDDDSECYRAQTWEKVNPLEFNAVSAMVKQSVSPQG